MAAVTVEPTPAMTTVAVVSMSAASPAHREHKHVSVCRVRTRALRAEARACGQAWAGAPWLALSLLPLGQVLRTRR